MSKTGRAAALPPERRRAAILAATVPLVRQHGYAVTTQQIAEAAGVAEGTLFRVFPSKDALLEEAVATALDPEPGLRKLAEIDLEAPLEERVAAAVEILRHGVESTWQLFAALRATAASRSSGRGSDAGHAGKPGRGHLHGPTPSRPEAWGQLTAAVATMLEPDRDRLAVTPEQAARVLGGLAITTLHRSPVPGAREAHGPESRLDTADVVGAVLYGVLGPRPEAPPRAPAVTAHRRRVRTDRSPSC